MSPRLSAEMMASLAVTARMRTRSSLARSASSARWRSAKSRVTFANPTPDPPQTHPEPPVAGPRRPPRPPAIGDVDPGTEHRDRGAGGAREQPRLVLGQVVGAVLVAEAVLDRQLLVGEQRGHFGEHPRPI